MITAGLRLLGIVAAGDGVAAQLTADCTAINADLSGDLPLAHTQVIADVDLGQLSVSHALLHFGR